MIGLVCHRCQRSSLRRLDAGVEASGPHDFAIRQKRRSSAALSASIASRPTSVTIASAPPEGRDGSRYRFDLGKRRREIFLNRGAGQGKSDLIVSTNHAQRAEKSLRNLPHKRTDPTGPVATRTMSEITSLACGGHPKIDVNDRAPRGRELSVREALTRIIVDWSGSWQAARPGWLGRSPATKAALGC